MNQFNSPLLIHGTSILEGFASGPLMIVMKPKLYISDDPCENSKEEIKKVKSVFLRAKDEIEHLIENKKMLLTPDELKIFESHILMIEDPEFQEQVFFKISNNHFQASKAVSIVSNEYAKIISELPDPYLSARSHDILDIGKRIISLLNNSSLQSDFSTQSQQNSSASTQKRGIYYFEELDPSMIAELDLKQVLGILSPQSGTTSHAAILLRTLEIPTLFDIKLNFAENSDRIPQPLVLLDSKHGYAVINPSLEQQKKYEFEFNAFQKLNSELQKLILTPTITKDGVTIKLHANINNPSELRSIEKSNPDGIGLFRTEFLFLDRHKAPSEDEQFALYKNILQSMNGKKVILRTLDIGGDKIIPYLQLPKEDNPFLGLRGLRLCLKWQELFRTQLRALLRASTYGNLCVMYPMVTKLEEWHAAQEILLEEKESLLKLGVRISDSIRFGIMIEVPAAALMANNFAQHVDFFSIGTNDLIQYTCACDRLNPEVKSLYSPFEPAVLKMIQMVVDAANNYKIEVSLCGEMGSSLDLIPFLIGCGLQEWSLTPHSLLKIKKRLLDLSQMECKSLASKILNCSSSTEVQMLLSEY